METCDKCGPAVAAAVTITLPSGKILTFCAHCARHYDKITTAALAAKG